MYTELAHVVEVTAVVPLLPWQSAPAGTSPMPRRHCRTCNKRPSCIQCKTSTPTFSQTAIPESRQSQVLGLNLFFRILSYGYVAFVKDFRVVQRVGMQRAPKRTQRTLKCAASHLHKSFYAPSKRMRLAQTLDLNTVFQGPADFFRSAAPKHMTVNQAKQTESSLKRRLKENQPSRECSLACQVTHQELYSQNMKHEGEGAWKGSCTLSVILREELRSVGTSPALQSASHLPFTTSEEN